MKAIDAKYMRKIRRPASKCALGFVALLLNLSGCASAPTSYDLAGSEDPIRAGRLRGVLALQTPKADDILNSDRILVRTGPDTLAILPNAQLADFLPELIQRRLRAIFEQAGQGAKIVNYGEAAERVLAIDIQTFEIDVTTHEARIVLAARMLASDGRPLAAKVFRATAPAPATANGQGPRALEQALRQILIGILRWSFSLA